MPKERGNRLRVESQGFPSRYMYSMNVVPVQDVVEFQAASHRDSLDDGVFLEKLENRFSHTGAY